MSAIVDYTSITAKLNNWEKSGRGRKELDKKLREYIRHDIRTTEAGSQVLTIKMMRECADALVRMVKEHASSASAETFAMVPSVMNDIKTLRRGPVTVTPDGGFVCEIDFRSDLSRPSLDPQRFPTGMPNIVALFNNGMSYDYDFNVVGEWHGKIVWATSSRPGMHFMQDAVAEFNHTYGDKYNIQVQLLDIYER